MARPRIAEEQSATFVVNLPETAFESHVKRVQTILAQHGYRAIAMSNEYVLQMAEQVRGEIAEAEQAQALLTHAAQRSPDQ